MLHRWRGYHEADGLIIVRGRLQNLWMQNPHPQEQRQSASLSHRAEQKLFPRRTGLREQSEQRSLRVGRHKGLMVDPGTNAALFNPNMWGRYSVPRLILERRRP